MWFLLFSRGNLFVMLCYMIMLASFWLETHCCLAYYCSALFYGLVYINLWLLAHKQ